MSRQLSNQETTEFEMEVKHEYQSMGDGVARSVRTKSITSARDAYFPRFGQGQATQRGAPSSDVVPMNIQSDRINIELNDYTAPEYTDIFEQEVTNVEDRQELAKVIAMAMMRREEQDIFDGLTGLTTFTTKNTRGTATRDNSFRIAHGNTSMTRTKISAAKATMKIRNVFGKMHGVANADVLENMLDDDKIANRDYDMMNSLVNGDITKWQGFEWHFIGGRAEGGLPLSGTTQTNYFWEEMSIGLIKSMLQRVEVNYIADKTSWLSNGVFQCGSEAIDPAGIVVVETLANT